MFSEFVSILSQTFGFLFVQKYLFAFIGIACCLGASVIRLFLRWFNA